MSDVRGAGDFTAADAEVLQYRAESLAVAGGEHDLTETRSLLLFRIADEWYAVDSGDVREIFQDYVVTPVPCVPAFILGVVNVRGEILSVTDPARMMHIGSVGGDARAAVLPAVVIANDQVATALVVDEIGDIVEVADTVIEPPVSIIDREQAEFVVGSAFVSNRMVGLLNVERMLQPIGS